MTVRPKIKEIAENTEQFKLYAFYNGYSYKKYVFVFEETKVEIFTYGFLFTNEARLSFSNKEINLKGNEKELLLKAFKKKRKKWKKENSNVVNFDLAEEIQQNDLLKKINFNKKE